MKFSKGGFPAKFAIRGKIGRRAAAPPRCQKPSEGAVWLLAAFNRSLAAASVINFVQCWPQGETPRRILSITLLTE